MSRQIGKTIGLISDTHGLLRPEALAALAGSDLVAHAGDVGDPAILDALRRVAPVVAIRGNVDTGAWAQALPDVATLELGAGLRAYMLHDLAALHLDPAAAGFCAVIAGHSHKPGIRRDGSVLHVNPGSAGRRRFSLPVTVGRVVVTAMGEVSATILELAI